MSNKILITGATGSLGSKVVNLLKEKTKIENLAVLVREEKNELAKQYANDDIEVKIGDYANSEIAKKISEIVNEPIQYISPTKNEFEEQMTKFGLPSHIIEILTTFSIAIATREFDHQSNDLETVLGRKTTSLSEFLQATYK
jgi:NADPH:quinone reductase-like Zn-dependent oxidoreductase